MTTNLVSTVPRRAGVGGSAKVFDNLARGLDAISAPYVINRDPDTTRRLWIHNDFYALPSLSRSRAKAVLGPNLFEMPADIPKSTKFDDAIYVLPSSWMVTLWREAGFDKCPLTFWPVGIDTVAFRPSAEGPPDPTVLVYYKHRSARELDIVEDALRRANLKYQILIYGRYTEAEYRQCLAVAPFVVWLGRHESQGIALQEALASDVPILVWDATSLRQSTQGYRYERRFWEVPVTSAPYFDERCGLKVGSEREFRSGLERIAATLHTFQPRRFVLDHLSLEKQAHEFLALWSGWPELRQADPETGGPLSDLRYRPVETLLWRAERRLIVARKTVSRVVEVIRRPS